MQTQGKTVSLPHGLMLPEDIGDVGDDITRLDLSDMGLIGKCRISRPARSKSLMMSSGNIPETLGNLTNLTRLDLSRNQLSGAYIQCSIVCCAHEQP
jgi:hypothetical protein